MAVSPEYKQAFFTLGAHTNMLSLGMVIAYTGTLLPALESPGSQIKIDVKTASWIVAIPGVAGVIPVILLGPLMHYRGRKPSNIFLSVPVLFGWLLTYLAGEFNSITMLLTGRFFQGLSAGSPYFISVCIGEFSSPKMRSLLLGLKPVSVVLGVFTIHFMAYFLEWKYLALVGVLPPLVGTLITIFWPETPEWLVSRERYEDATVVFNYIRGKSDEGERELRHLIDCERRRRKFDEENRQKGDVWRKAKSPVLWKPLGILFFTVLLPTVGGRQFIPAYSVELCSQLGGAKSNGYLYTIVADIVAIVAVLGSLYLTKVYNRRQLLFGSGFVGVIMLGLCSLTIYMGTIYQSRWLSWLSLGMFGAYYFIANIGLMPVSFILMGEIFPLEYRAVGSVIDGILGTAGMTIVLWIVPLLKKSVGVHGLLLVFGCLMLLCLVYLYCELPETKNRTLTDIGDYFRGHSPKIRRGSNLAVNVEENRAILEKQSDWVDK